MSESLVVNHNTEAFPTPGPWRVTEDFSVQAVDGDVVHTPPFSPADDRDKANCRLIAAAPALFDLLSQAVAIPEDRDEWMRQAKDALAMAPVPAPELGSGFVSGAVLNFEVWVRLKKTSKYYHQGLVDPHADKPKARFFKLDAFVPVAGMGLSRDAYSLKFNSNSYRLEDCEVFLVNPKDTRAFMRIL